MKIRRQLVSRVGARLWEPRVLLAAALAGCLTGCAGYKLGSMLPRDIKTVSVPTFVNKTSEPLIEVETTRATIAEIQKDGSLHVADESAADSILQVTLVHYTLSPLAYEKGTDRTATRQYRLTITASILLKRRADDTVIVENPRVRGESVFDVVGDLTTSKNTGLPDAAEDLAHEIVERLVEVW